MPGMKITLDAAMRARDVSRPLPHHESLAEDPGLPHRHPAGGDERPPAAPAADDARRPAASAAGPVPPQRLTEPGPPPGQRAGAALSAGREPARGGMGNGDSRPERRNRGRKRRPRRRTAR